MTTMITMMCLRVICRHLVSVGSGIHTNRLVSSLRLETAVIFAIMFRLTQS